MTKRSFTIDMTLIVALLVTGIGNCPVVLRKTGKTGKKDQKGDEGGSHCLIGYWFLK